MPSCSQLMQHAEYSHGHSGFALRVLIRSASHVCTPPSLAFLMSPALAGAPNWQLTITVRQHRHSKTTGVAPIPALMPSCCSLSMLRKSSTSSASASGCSSLQSKRRHVGQLSIVWRARSAEPCATIQTACQWIFQKTSEHVLSGSLCFLRHLRSRA